MSRIIALIGLCIVFLSQSAHAQWTPIWGKQRFMQGLAIPFTDTGSLKNVSDTGCIVLNRDDSTIYYRYKGDWRPLGGGSGTTPTLQQVTDAGATTTNTITVTDGANYGYLTPGAVQALTLGATGQLWGYGVNWGQGGVGSQQLLPILNNPNNANFYLYNSTTDATTNDTLATRAYVRANAGSSASTAADTAKVVIMKVHNAESTTLQRGEVVYLYGANGDNASVKRAKNTGDATSANTLGFVRRDIPAGDTGWVTTQGQIEKLNLGAYTAGQIIYLDSIAGQFTTTKPTAPYHMVYLGVIERANNGNGLIYVKPQNGYEIDELHDVKITSKANNDVIAYESSTNLWKNKSIPTVLGYTPIAPADTSVFDRKSSAAWTFHANNTNATANMTDQAYRNPGAQTYSSTITWNNTAPSGTTNHSYRFTQIGQMVTLNIHLNYGTAGVNNSTLQMALPTDCPTPAAPAGLGSANDLIYPGSGYTNTSNAIPAAVPRCGLRVNPAGSGYEIYMGFTGIGAKTAWATVTYWTN